MGTYRTFSRHGGMFEVQSETDISHNAYLAALHEHRLNPRLPPIAETV
jgi:hypothetical protein